MISELHMLGSGHLSHIRVAVIIGADEGFLDGPGVDPAQQVEFATCLVVCSGSPGTTEGLQSDYCAGRFIVNIKITGCIP